MRYERVVGDPKPAGREEVVPVAVVGEGTGLSDQPVDDVPILDPVAPAAAQPREAVHPLLPIPDFQLLRANACLYPFANEPAVHRVGVVLHRDRGGGADPHAQPLAGIQPCGGKRSQPPPLLLKAFPPAGVELVKELLEESGVLRTALELAAAAQHQLLVERHFETMMALLYIPVLVAPARVGRLGPEAVVRQQRLVAVGERSPAVGGGAVDGGGKRIGAVASGNAAEFEERLLQALREALETLGKADAARLPVRVGEHKVIQQVRKRPPGDHDPQVRKVAEVGSAEIAGMVLLREEDLPGRSLGRAPLLHLALQTAELPIREAA